MDILHVDVDAFFASVEQALDPRLKGKPLIVGGDPNDRSVVSSASYEARRYGVRSAMPVAQARRLCPDGIFVRGSYERYGEFSHRIREVLARYSPVVQVASIDDFYLDLTGCKTLHGPPLEAAEKMKLAVRDEIGLNITIAVAGNKLVAKVASELAKPNGLIEIWRGCEAAFLRPLPADRLPGVGPSTMETLRKYNLNNIGDIAALTREQMEQMFGQSGGWLWERANGIDDTPVAVDEGPPKSIGRETTFPEDTIDRAALRATLYSLTERAARQLREEELLARRVTVKVRYSSFQTVSAAKMLPRPTDRDDELFYAARERLEYLLTKRLSVRLVGVSLSGFVSTTKRQAQLFADPDAERRRRFYKGLDNLRDRFGFDIARLGPAQPREDDKNK